jgi:hypothetical protein
VVLNYLDCFIIVLFYDAKFEKPGRRENFDYPDMAKEAATKALADAKINYNEIKQAVVGFVYGKLMIEGFEGN